MTKSQRVCIALCLRQVLATASCPRVWPLFQSSHSQSVDTAHHLERNCCFTIHDAFRAAVDKSVKHNSHECEIATTSFPEISFYQMSHHYH